MEIYAFMFMTDSIKMINYLKSKSGFCYRNYDSFSRDIDAQYDKLLVHKNVRWLSEGNALIRICQIWKDLLAFLETCGSSAEIYFNMLNVKSTWLI